MDNQNISKERTEYLLQKKRHRRTIQMGRGLFLLLFLLLWEVCSHYEIIDPFIFSSPSRIFLACGELLHNGYLAKHLSVTLWETIVGFLSGTILGTLFAILLWWSPTLSDFAEPFLVVFSALPKTALAPIIIVWIGNNAFSIITVALLTNLITTILTVHEGFCRVSPQKLRLIQVLGGSKIQMLRKVVLPQNIPCMVNAMKVNVGLSLVGVMVGEFLVAKAGLGYLITYGSQTFKMSWVLLSVCLLGILAGVFYQGILLLEKAVRKRFQ